MSTARPLRTEASYPAGSLLSEEDLYWFNEGTHRRMGDKLGAHVRADGGVTFGVWAPNATRVAVIGDFNGWNADADVLAPRGSSGIWEGVAAAAGHGHVYKFAITTRAGDVLEKADPVRGPGRASTADGLRRVGPGLRMERPRLPPDEG